MILLKLFYEFMKIGLFTVGGGMACVPFLLALSEKTGWYTEAQLLDMIAISESTPGPIGINMATYTGYTVEGIVGAVIATLGIVIPTVILVLCIAKFLESFKDNKYVLGGHVRAAPGLHRPYRGGGRFGGSSVAVWSNTDAFMAREWASVVEPKKHCPLRPYC